MPANEFSRICREFGSLSESIKIETNKDHVRFAIVGEIGSGNTVISHKDTGDEKDSVILDVDEPVSLNFAARYLNLFSKACGLATQVYLNMSSETPLMVQFKMPNHTG